MVVVTTVTSLTIVPNSSCSDSTRWAWMEGGPGALPSYGGRGAESNAPEDDREDADASSTFTGISLHIRRDRRRPKASLQGPT